MCSLPFTVWLEITKDFNNFNAQHTALPAAFYATSRDSTHAPA
jgi:hypothetical protein